MGTGRLTWRRFRSYLDGLRHTRESAFWRAVDTEGEGLWSVDSYILATIADAVIAANWQRSKDGQKGTNKPKPLPRPGEKRRASQKADLVRSSIAARKRMREQQQRSNRRE